MAAFFPCELKFSPARPIFGKVFVVALTHTDCSQKSFHQRVHIWQGFHISPFPTLIVVKIVETTRRFSPARPLFGKVFVVALTHTDCRQNS